MVPVDSGDKAEGASSEESASGAREIKGARKRPGKRSVRGGALFSRKGAPPAGALKDGVPVPGAKVSGRFRIDKLLAKGGMGTVWFGKDLELDRPVAVKFMDPSFAEKEDLRSRFTREAKAAARLRTKHVVEIHEFGVDGTTPYIVMELLEGEDLHTHLKRVKRVSLETAASIVVQCCRALKKAGDANIVHRDLKPGNVYLSRDLDEIVVKILDFGVAKLIDSETEVTRAGTMLGSPQYMSPEQAVGERVDHRSDLWALAAIIFRMLTGRIAFSGKSAGDIIIKLCTAPLPVPSQVNAKLPASIDAFFEIAFARDPDERFQSATELSEAFVAAVGEASVSDPQAFGAFANYADLPSGRGRLPSGDFGTYAPGTPAPGTPVSGVLSPLRDGGGAADLDADTMLNAGPASDLPPDSSPDEGVTRAANLEAAEAAHRAIKDVKKGAAKAKPNIVDDPSIDEPLPDLTPKSRPSLGITAADIQVKHRGLPAVVWVLFIAAMAVGAFLAYFFQSRPETGNLLEDLNLGPANLPTPTVTASASAAPETVIDPLRVTPETSASADLAPSAAPSTASSAGVPPGGYKWPVPAPVEEPKEKPIEKDPYE